MSVRHYLMLYISLTIMKLIRRTACFPSACGFYQSLFPFMVLKPTLNYSVYIIKTHGPSYKKKSEISICWSSPPALKQPRRPLISFCSVTVILPSISRSPDFSNISLSARVHEIGMLLYFSPIKQSGSRVCSFFSQSIISVI